MTKGGRRTGAFEQEEEEEEEGRGCMFQSSDKESRKG